MDLVLWRHCEAAQGVPDDARPLTPHGLEQATRAARWLAARLPADARILVSPAVRAQQTAAALGRRYETHDAVGTATSVDALLDAVQSSDASGTVLVVGHQPTLGQVVSALVDGDDAGHALAPGDVVWLAATNPRGAGATIALSMSYHDLGA